MKTTWYYGPKRTPNTKASKLAFPMIVGKPPLPPGKWKETTLMDHQNEHCAVKVVRVTQSHEDN